MKNPNLYTKIIFSTIIALAIALPGYARGKSQLVAVQNQLIAENVSPEKWPIAVLADYLQPSDKLDVLLEEEKAFVRKLIVNAKRSQKGFKDAQTYIKWNIEEPLHTFESARVLSEWLSRNSSLGRDVFIAAALQVEHNVDNNIWAVSYLKKLSATSIRKGWTVENLDQLAAKEQSIIDRIHSVNVDVVSHDLVIPFINEKETEAFLDAGYNELEFHETKYRVIRELREHILKVIRLSINQG